MDRVDRQKTKRIDEQKDDLEARTVLNFGTWNIKSLMSEECEITEEIKKWKLDVLGVSAIKK